MQHLGTLWLCLRADIEKRSAAEFHEDCPELFRRGIGCHTFRTTGITNYLVNGGTLEKAQQFANHERARTTKLYDRRDDKLSLDEVE